MRESRHALILDGSWLVFTSTDRHELSKVSVSLCVFSINFPAYQHSHYFVSQQQVVQLTDLFSASFLNQAILYLAGDANASSLKVKYTEPLKVYSSFPNLRGYNS